jgi:hypothetical protein
MRGIKKIFYIVKASTLISTSASSLYKGRLGKVFPFLSFIFFLFSPLFALSAVEREEDLAVLNIQKGENIPKEIDTNLLRRLVMGEAQKITNYRIMTDENVFAILRDKGIDPNKCGEFECAVEYGRLLQADKLIVGSLSLVQGIYYFSLTLYDTASASIDNSVTRKCENCRFEDLVSLAKSSTRELFGKAKLPEEEREKEEEEVVVRFTSEPKGAILEIEGTPVCNTPCSRLLSEGSYRIAFKHPQYFVEEREIIVKRGMGSVSAKLKPREGTIKVRAFDEEGNAVEADVYLDGKKIGSAPGTFKAIIGEHRLRVESEDAFYEKEISIEEKKVITIDAKLQRIRVRKEERNSGIFIYPTINYSFSSGSGFNYGAGFGYKVSIPFLLAFGIEWTYGTLSNENKELTDNLFKLYSMLGIDFIKNSKLGLYTKPSLNIEHLSAESYSNVSPTFRVEFGFHSFLRPVHIFTGFFIDSDLMGISFSIGGYL